MREPRLRLSVDTGGALAELREVEDRLLEEFPEFGRDLLHRLLLCVLNERPVFTAGPASGASDGVIRLQIGLDTALIFEIVASALRTLDADGVSHG